MTDTMIECRACQQIKASHHFRFYPETHTYSDQCHDCTDTHVRHLEQTIKDLTVKCEERNRVHDSDDWDYGNLVDFKHVRRE